MANDQNQGSASNVVSPLRRAEHAFPQAGKGDMGSQVSSEFSALRGMYIALIYELNELPDFPRKQLIEGLGKMTVALEENGEPDAAQLVHETQVVLSVQLGDDD